MRTDDTGTGPAVAGGSPLAVQETPPPEYTPAAARAIALELWGIAAEVTPLASERDQNFRIRDASGSVCVLKIANQAEDPGVADFQTQALTHIAAVAPALPVPRVVPARDGRLSVTRRCAAGHEHALRVLSYLPGKPLHRDTPEAWPLAAMGATLADLGLALRGFFHPAARHPQIWDLQQAAHLQPLLVAITPAGVRALVGRQLERFERHVAPRLPAMRAQVIHNDLNPDNVLLEPASGAIAGIIDFGDMVYGPLVGDVAIALSYLLGDQEDPLAPALDFLAAYHERVPLEALEFEALPHLIATRLAATIAISSWRAARYPGNREYVLRSNAGAIARLRRLEGARGMDLRARLAGAHGAGSRVATAPASAAQDELLVSRQRYLGPAYRLFYERPLHIVRGSGAYLYDARGQAFLDAYNNVAQVGHCHPRVVEALSRQAACLNTHTRYMHETVVEYAARLTALFPDGLDLAMLACTGSEANELALRIARASTGNEGIIALEYAYHGNSRATAELSEIRHARDAAPHVRLLPAPDSYRLPPDADPQALCEYYLRHVEAACDSLRREGHGVAAMIVDTIFSCPGIVTPPPRFLAAAADIVRAAGGVLIADEVQAGLGRTGEHLWGFEAYGLVPELVTLGKPLGNGYPLAAVVAQAGPVEAFAGMTDYFNTFGGNPVAAAAGLAVLDVMRDEPLQRNARELGRRLRAALRELQTRHRVIGDVRGRGLFVGVELVSDRQTRAPATHEAGAVVNDLRDNGVLIGATGPHGNVLKLRPPLVVSAADITLLVERLDAALAR